MNTDQKPSSTNFGQGLISQLERWKAGNEFGIFADLRSGLGKRPGEATRMFPHLSRFIVGNDAQIQATLLTASLYSLKRNHTNSKKNLAKALRDLLPREIAPEDSSISHRLAAAMDADREELWYHLQSLVQFINNEGGELNWVDFYYDVLTFLGEDDDKINKLRLQWARDFWGPVSKSHSEEDLSSSSISASE